MADLDDALAAYLKRPWLQDDAIDASAINAMLFTELTSFSEQMKSGAAFGKLNWSYALSGGNLLKQIGYAFAFAWIGFLARWIMLPAIAVALLVNGHETDAQLALIVWGIYLIYRLITIPAALRRRRAWRKASETLQALLKAWSAARGNVINPSRLKELVLNAEERGAVLPSALHAVVDRAISRDPTALLRSNSQTGLSATTPTRHALCVDPYGAAWGGTERQSCRATRLDRSKKDMG